MGQAAAAEQNRHHRARAAILQALGRLGIPQRQLPDFIQAYYRNSTQRNESRQLMSMEAFQSPPFDRLNESAGEWRRKADAQWEQVRERFLQGLEFWVTQGVDEEIQEAKLSRS